MTWPWTNERNYKPAHILVEDNDASIREIMASLLAAEGYECQVAETLVETSKILGSGKTLISLFAALWSGRKKISST